MALLQYRAPVKYSVQRDIVKDFLLNFKGYDDADAAEGIDDLHLDADNGDVDMETRRREPKLKYMRVLQEVADRMRNNIVIELDDLETYMKAQPEGPDSQLVERVEGNCQRYVDVFSVAIDEMMPQPSRDISFKSDVYDILMSQRLKRNQTLAMAAEAGADEMLGAMFPPELTRRYTLNFKPRTSEYKALAVREVRGQHLGALITVRGIVTRVSDVKPAIKINSYTCERCGSEVFQPVTTKQFTPMTECPSEECKQNSVKGDLYLSTRASKFVPFQEVKMQEMADQVPVGHIPRTLTVHCSGAVVRQANPGDMVDIAGIFLPTPYTGFRAIRAGLLTDTYLEAQYVRQHKKAYDSLVLDGRTLRKIEQHQMSGNMYEYLSRSIAPEIYGHLDVKKALLLLLIGGVTKEMGDGMRIRGDINICLMGDPGVAKSQLLRYISKVAPRGVYTSGRGSSGVGLTAAVMRDPVTDEMVLEGGALVLADNGICCIDEFDKMDESDRTAIHEVMEQQTISISKAGISTTLNARTSILAAANPLYGRYNPRVSPVENINLPAALLSRFDVLFLMLDTPNRDADEELAAHVTYVHMHGHHPEADQAVFSPHEVRQYIARARAHRPVVPPAVADYMVGAYVRMRQQQKKVETAAAAGGSGRHPQNHSHTSPRTLLGVLRLAQALARLRFADTVVAEDVDEALRLVEVSKASLQLDPAAQAAAAGGADQSPVSKIYNLLCGLRDSGAAAAEEGVGGELSLRRVRDRVVAKGFTDDQLAETIEEYSELGILQVVANGTRLVFLDWDDDEMEM